MSEAKGGAYAQVINVVHSGRGSHYPWSGPDNTSMAGDATTDP